MPQDPFAQFVVTPPSSGSDPFAEFAVKNDPSRLPTRPVSAEDFAPAPQSWPATLGDFALGIGKRLTRSAIDLGAQGLASGAIPGGNPAVSVASEALKPTYDTPAQDVGGDVGAVLEFAGPAISAARTVPAVASSAARKVIPAVGEMLAKDTPLLTQVRQAAARKILGRAIDMVAEKPVAQAGSRLVKGAEPSLDDVIASALDELRAPARPTGVELPPPPTLPPGYTPRATAPRPSAAPAPAPAAMPIPTPARPAPSAPAPGRTAYFLRSPEELAAMRTPAAPRAPRESLTVADLPESWKSRVGQDVFPSSGAESKQIRAAILAEIKDRGLSVGQALSLVSRNKDIPSALRDQLMRTLSKAGS